MIKHGILIAVSLAGMYGISAIRRTSEGLTPPGHDVPDALYGTNCAGCHGADAKGGAARGLIDPVFLEIADEGTIRRVTAQGVPGTAMPAFAKESGGSLTGEQIDTIVRGIRARWIVRPQGALGITPRPATRSTETDPASDLSAPPYSPSRAGDPDRGGETFATFCSRCHGADGRGGRGSQGASSIVDPSYLALVSDQSLRTTVIAGRPDLGAPDWRENVPGQPMSPEEISDVVAWLAAKRGTTR